MNAELMTSGTPLRRGQKMSRVALVFFALMFAAGACMAVAWPVHVRLFSLTICTLFFCVAANRNAIASPGKSFQWKTMPPLSRTAWLACILLFALSAVLRLTDI